MFYCLSRVLSVEITIKGLLIRNNEPLRVACLTLINALITSPEDLDFRFGFLFNLRQGRKDKIKLFSGSI